MEGKFKKFFEAQQEKGAFKGLEFKELNEAQSQELLSMYLDDLESQFKELKQKAEAAEGDKEELNNQLKEMSADYNATTARISKLNLELAEEATKNLIKTAQKVYGGNGQNAIEVAKTFHNDLTEAVKNGDSEVFTIRVKDVMAAVYAAKADTLTTSVVNPTRGVEDPNVTRLAHRRLTAYNAIPSKPRVGRNMGGTYRYLEQSSANSVRAAAAIAEGAPSPESTIEWEKKSIDLKKVSDHIPYSDEFEYDFNDLMIELVAFLRQNIDIEVDEQIINGDGTGENFTGWLLSIPAYVPTAAGITDANIFDLVVKVSTDITKTEGSKYMPNIYVMTSDDIDSINFELKKDSDNNYIPLRERLERRGFTLIENNSLAVGTMIVGDNRYAHIVEDGVITVKTGLKSGADAIEGISRVLVETRKNMLIKEEEATAWREVTDINAALVVLES